MVSATHRRTHLPLIAAVAAVIAWGFGPLFVRGIDADASVIIFWRVIIALPIAVGVAFAAGGRLTPGLVRRAVPTGICFALSIIAGFSSFQKTSIVNATLIPALSPALVLIVASRMFGERRSRTEVVCAAIAFGGVALVVVGSHASGGSVYGDLLAVANLLVFTGYFLLAKQIRADNVHSWSFLAAIFVVTSIVVTPWSLVVTGGVEPLHGSDWLLVLGLVLLPGMVGHGFMTWAHHYVDVSVTSTLTLANPVVSIVGAWLLFSESLVVVQIVGAVIVLLSLGAIVRRQRGDRALAAEAAVAGDLLDGLPLAGADPAATAPERGESDR